MSTCSTVRTSQLVLYEWKHLKLGQGCLLLLQITKNMSMNLHQCIIKSKHPVISARDEESIELERLTWKRNQAPRWEWKTFQKTQVFSWSPACNVTTSSKLLDSTSSWCFPGSICQSLNQDTVLITWNLRGALCISYYPSFWLGGRALRHFSVLFGYWFVCRYRFVAPYLLGARHRAGN